METKNIWEKLKFTDTLEVSAYDLLIQQSKFLIIATSGELKMEVGAMDSYLEDGNKTIPVALYVLYVVAPNLANFKTKILTVCEGRQVETRFPVDIYCHIDNEKLENISENNFIDVISEILSRKLVKKSIEDLYKTSKEYTKNLI